MYYKLGPKASSFWDPTQPTLEQTSLSIGEVKELHPSPTVATWKRNGGLEEATQEDFDKYQEALQKNLAAKEEEATSENKDIAAAYKAVKNAEKAKKQVETKLESLQEDHDELNTKHEELASDHKELQEAHDKLVTENEDLKSKLAAPPALTPAPDETGKGKDGTKK